MKKFIIILLLLPLISVSAQNIDIDILRNINLNRNTNLDGAFRGISNSVTPLVIGTPVLLFSFGMVKKDSVLTRKSLCIGATVLTSAIITSILKYSINRTRPFITYPDIEKAAPAGSPSFPSGHTSDAFALATSLSLAFPKWYIIAPSFAWAGAVGYSRMDLGVHYPSDVLMGAVIGAGSAYLCYKGKQWLLKRKS
jgi:membrane-associated phospholipid phosphatase